MTFVRKFRRRRHRQSAPLILFGACLLSGWVCGAEVAGGEIVLRPASEPSHGVSSLLFGQFLERFQDKAVVEGGEMGAEAAVLPGEGELQPGVIELFGRLDPGVIRFPGGMALEFDPDWTKLVDHSPFRTGGERPAGFRFGLHEFFGLCGQLGAEPLVGVNFRAAVWGEDGPMDPEGLAAGLVAYCNLPVGADRPDGVPDWPSWRARNGHRKPFGVKYFQIGNEWAVWLKGTNTVRASRGDEEFADAAALGGHVRERLLAMIRAMRAVDPSIQIIIDAVHWNDMVGEILEGSVLGDPEVREAADFAAVHLYRPWGVDAVRLNGEEVGKDTLSAEDYWYATVAVPNIGDDGFSRLGGRGWELARRLDWPVVMTEWNWNGWGIERPGATLWPRALGVAGFLHAMLRESGRIHLATQSMMVGNDWMITAVRVDPEAEKPPYLLPSGRMTGFYAEFRGDRFLPVDVIGAPVRPQPVGMGGIAAASTLALIDVVATESAQAVYLHVINRDKDRAHVLRLDPAGRRFDRRVEFRRIAGRDWNPVEALFVSPDQFDESRGKLNLVESGDTLRVPPGTVTTFRLEKL